MICAT